MQNQLFGIHEGDIETDYDPRTGIPTTEEPPTDPPPAAIAPAASVSSGGQPTVAPGAAATGSKVKVKIVHKDDIFAIKVPADSTLDQLREKIFDRLGFEVSLKYKDDASGDSLPLEDEMDMEEAFASAIKLGKLTVYAERI